MKKRFLSLFLMAVLCCVGQMAWAAAGPICEKLLGSATATSGQYVPAYVKWETDTAGNVNITIFPYDATEETATMPTRWRGRGMANDLSAGWSMTIDGTAVTIGDYFEKNYSAVSDKKKQNEASSVYQLKIKSGKKSELVGHTVVITRLAKDGGNICWWTPRYNDAYCTPSYAGAMEYLYGSKCAVDELLPPTNVQINGNTISFTAADKATGYVAGIYNGTTQITTQSVTSGATLVEPMLSAMTYTVKVKSVGAGGAESEESNGVEWETTDRSKQKEELDGSEYCDFVIGSTGTQAAMDWTTDADGNINIDIKKVDGTSANWRGTGFKGIEYFKVGKVPASFFFDVTYTQGSTNYQLTKKTGVTLGWGETINFKGDVQWSVDGSNSYLLSQTYAYTYGTGCASLAKPVITNVDADTVITFEPVENAETYEATVTYGTTIIAKQNVESGDKLKFKPYVDGDYSVTLVAMAEGMANSEPSDAKVLSLTVAPFTPAASEICIYPMQSAQETDTTHNVAYLSAETNDQGQIVFTIKGEAGCRFRGNAPLDLTKMQMGGTTAATFFTAAVDNATYTLTPKAGSGIGLGAVINFKGSISWRTDGWENSYVENKSLTFTYGNAGCTDEAPVLVAAAEALDATSVRVSMTATDDHNLPITYTIQRAGENDTILYGASGAEVTCDFINLTPGTTYYYTVFATDGFNPTAPQQLSATPAGDTEAPTNVVLTLKSLTLTDAKLTVVADDNYPADLTYTITGEGITEPLVGAPSVPVVKYLSGMTPGQSYIYSVVATDAAGNSAEPVQATLVMDSVNILLNKTATAGCTQTGHEPSKGVDGDNTTYWGNYGLPTFAEHNNWLSVNCNGVYEIKSVAITWSHFPDYAGFMLQLRNGNEEWQTVYTHTGAKCAKDSTQIIDLDTPAQATDVRVFSEGATNTWYMAIFEVAAFGKALADTEAPQNLTISGESLSEESLRLHMYAEDNSFGDLTYTVYVDGTAQSTTKTAPQATEVTYDVEGLTPGQTYELYYTVADASANMSTSTTIQLTTLTEGENIAYHKLATAGSTEAGHDASKAVDGDKATYWGNYGKAVYEEQNNWLAVDLCGTFVVNRVSIVWSHFPDYAGFYLQAKEGEGEWQTIYTYTGDKYSKGQTQVIDLATPVQATDIRVFSEGATQTWYMAISELKAFGEGAVQINEDADNSARIAAMAGLTTDVKLSRAFAAGTKATFCVPFDMNAEQIQTAFGDAIVYMLTDAYWKSEGALYINFNKVKTIAAGTPYIILPAQAFAANTVIEDVTFSAASVATGNELVSFYGVTSATALEAGKYVLNSADACLYPTSAGTLRGLRGYFELNLTSEQQAAMRSCRAIFSNTEAVVVTTNLDENAAPEMQNSKFILDGEFIIIRDGKMYNAQGQVR